MGDAQSDGMTCLTGDVLMGDDALCDEGCPV